MTTEAQAATKLCPLSFNRGAKTRPWHCAGSACMAWRWRDYAAPVVREVWWPHLVADITDEVLLKSIEGPKRPADVPPEAQWMPLVDDYSAWQMISMTGRPSSGIWRETNASYEARQLALAASRHGYCGQFGRPEVGA